MVELWPASTGLGEASKFGIFGKEKEFMDASLYVVPKASFYGLGGIGKFVFNLERIGKELGNKDKTTARDKQQNLQQKSEIAAAQHVEETRQLSDYKRVAGKSRSNHMDVKASFKTKRKNWKTGA
ncbi:unnamed protein product [Dovyalis caffra]|uniref:Uncharacterized protein n=1 Tax=Dovyalis caffra TaxID=77055 RepID=A0AAV1R167_9ROSI|nr:unnamed protein product [Dovyalis caffra]